MITIILFVIWGARNVCFANDSCLLIQNKSQTYLITFLTHHACTYELSVISSNQVVKLLIYYSVLFFIRYSTYALDIAFMTHSYGQVCPDACMEQCSI